MQYQLLSTLALVALLTAPQTAMAAPTPDAGDWMIELNGSDPKAAWQNVMDFYKAQGMTNAAAKATRVTIGDSFHAMAAPAGGDADWDKIQTVNGVVMCEKSVEWSVVDLERAPPTGLDRIDQTTGGLDGAFNFSPTGGQNVDVYVIDTGVDVNHPDIKGRAEVFDVTGEGLQDLNGHGSHVSGTIAGTKFGIAKQARITGIKVFSKSGKGANSNILRALGQVSALQKQRNRPGVVNMSLGGPRGSAQSDSVISKAIQALTAQGVSIAVAAGNENADACGSSPAFVPEVITVGAVDPKNDKFASFSNFGKCVDIIAPGVQIESIAANTAGKSKFLSGTSMSTPHVAGVLAVLMSEGLSRADAEAKLLGTATNGVVKGNLKGSPNKLLFLKRAAAASGNNRQNKNGSASSSSSSTTAAQSSSSSAASSSTKVVRSSTTTTAQSSASSSTPCTGGAKPTETVQPTSTPCTGATESAQPTETTPCTGTESAQPTETTPCTGATETVQPTSTPCTGTESAQPTETAPCTSTAVESVQPSSTPCTGATESAQPTETTPCTGGATESAQPTETTPCTGGATEAAQPTETTPCTSSTSSDEPKMTEVSAPSYAAAPKKHKCHKKKHHSTTTASSPSSY